MKNRKRNRMQGYDYSKDNLYFVTICVDKMRCCLGDIVDAKIKDNLNSNSECVGTARELSVRREFSNSPNSEASHQIMQLNQYGIIVLKRLHWLAKHYKYVVIHSHVVMPNHVHLIIEIDSLLIPDVGIKIKSLSELIGAFKSTSSKLIHDDQFSEFKWKRSFHDHIIKDVQSFQNISSYIIHNPSNWKLDSLNPTRLKV